MRLFALLVVLLAGCGHKQFEIINIDDKGHSWIDQPAQYTPDPLDRYRFKNRDGSTYNPIPKT